MIYDLKSFSSRYGLDGHGIERRCACVGRQKFTHGFPPTERRAP